MRIDNLEYVKEFLESNKNNIEMKKSLYMKIIANTILKRRNPKLNDYNLDKLDQIINYMELHTISSPGWKKKDELNYQEKQMENWEQLILSNKIVNGGLTPKQLEQIANIDIRNISKFNKEFLTNLVMAKHVDELNNDSQYGPEHFISDVSFFNKNYGGFKTMIKKKKKNKNSKRTYKLKKSKKLTYKLKKSIKKH